MIGFQFLQRFVMTTGVLVFLGTAGPVAWEAVESKRSLETSSALAEPAEPPTLVRAFVVGSEPTNAAANSFVGTVRARYEVQVAFRVSGKILKRHIEVGDRVVRGQPLFELDRGDYELQQKNALANLEVTKAAMQQAVAEERRLAILRRTNAVGDSEYEVGLSNRDVATGRYAAAQKQLELADNQLSYCQLAADADGIVTSIDAEAGQVVSVGARVCTIAQGGELEAVVDIPENRLPSEQRLLATARFWSLPGVQSEARLRELSPTADPVTRTFRGRFTLSEPSADIKLGMTATVEWSDGNIGDEIAIPASAIMQQNGQPAVWRVEPKLGKLTAVPVVIAHYGDERVYVSSGLSEGEQIVSAGVHKLDVGMRVRVWESR